MNLQELNPWWIEKAVKSDFAPATYRDLFREVKRDLGRKQIQLIAGLRRVGKSTIIFQLIDNLIKEGTNPLHIIYCSFDEPELQEKRIEDILKEYSKLTGVEYKNDKIYLFLDEIQKSREWVAGLKLGYDNLHTIKMLCSGSASLNILTEAKRSLGGRAIYYELKPLSFEEFLNLKGVKIEKERFLLYKDVLEREFDKFLLRPFPELIHEEDTLFIKKYIRDAVIDPIILKDIPKEFEDVDILLLEKLVNIFLTNPGQHLSVDDLSKELRRAKTTIYNAIFYLEVSFIIKKILNYRPSIRAASRKLSRIYAYHPILTIPFGAPEDKFAENLVMFELGAQYYWREKEKEIDFLKNSDLIEVKMKSKISKEDTRWIHYFLEKYGNAFKTYIITKDLEGNIDKISLIPLWKFCFKGLNPEREQ